MWTVVHLMFQNKDTEQSGESLHQNVLEQTSITKVVKVAHKTPIAIIHNNVTEQSGDSCPPNVLEQSSSSSNTEQQQRQQ